MELILASSSPRRKELLENFGYSFRIHVEEVIEYFESDNPYEVATSLAVQKAEPVFAKNPDAVVIGSDTIVAVNGKLLGKPKNVEEAKEMLMMLSGTSHEVVTGFAILSKDQVITDYEVTTVTFHTITNEECQWYIDTNEPFDKAGGYGIQSKGAYFVKEIKGDFHNVMGLPICKVARALQQFRISLPS